MSDAAPLLEHLLTGPTSMPMGFSDLDHWWAWYSSATAKWALPIDRAIVGGFASDRVAWAFAAGYQAALRALLPAVPDDRIAVLSVTEAGGGHPRAIETSAVEAGGTWTLNGTKKWASLASSEAMLYVVASEGEEAGRKVLSVFAVPSDAEGVTVAPMPPMPFAPEIPHCRVELDGVEVSNAARVPGDGYREVVKPFRTVEDIHVTAAMVAHVLRVGRTSEWTHEAQAHLVRSLVTLRGLAQSDPNSAAVHIALHGALEDVEEGIAGPWSDWSMVDAEVVKRWERDSALMAVASSVRGRRTAAAWSHLVGV